MHEGSCADADLMRLRSLPIVLTCLFIGVKTASPVRKHLNIDFVSAGIAPPINGILHC